MVKPHYNIYIYMPFLSWHDFEPSRMLENLATKAVGVAQRVAETDGYG